MTKITGARTKAATLAAAMMVAVAAIGAAPAGATVSCPGGGYVRMYKDVSLGGPSFVQYRGSRDSDLSNSSGPVGFNDSLDSHKWC